MKLTHSLAAVALSLTALAAQAEITGNAAVVSDYNWRGISQTSQDPALQGGIDYAHESGFYAGAWGSNVDFGDCCDENVEVDLYTGFRGGDAVTWDVGFIYYWYPGAEDIDFPEIYVGLGYEWLSGKVSYSNDFGNSGESAFYYEANASYDLPANFGITGHLGYSDGDAIDLFYDRQLHGLVGRRDLRRQPLHARPEVRRRQRPRDPRRHARRREQQRRRGDLLRLDQLPLVEGVSRPRVA